MCADGTIENSTERCMSVSVLSSLGMPRLQCIFLGQPKIWVREDILVVENIRNHLPTWEIPHQLHVSICMPGPACVELL